MIRLARSPFLTLFVVLSLGLSLLMLSSVTTHTANAEVRFGKNVRVGGHDASNQRFNRKRRGKYIIHKGRPKNPGCRWRKNRDGSKTKVCHLQRKKRR